MQFIKPTLKDVETFIEQIAGEINDFHPLTDFKDYVRPQSYFRRYTDEEAKIRNKYLDRCFEVRVAHSPNFFSCLLQLFEQVMDRLADEHTTANESRRCAYQLDLFLVYPQAVILY